MENKQIVTNTHFSDLREKLKELAVINSQTVFDYESTKGEKEARSHIYTMRQTKSEVAKRHKELKENILKEGREIDAVKNELTKSIDNMIEVHDEPLRIKSERLENEKQAALAIEKFNRDYDAALVDNQIFDQQKDIERREAELKAKEEEQRAKEEAARIEKERLEREEQIRKEAADKAVRDAEIKAQLEKEALMRKEIEAQLEIKRIAKAAEDAALKAKIEAEEAEKRRLADIKEAYEKAEREKQEALESQRREQEEKERLESERIAHENAIDDARKADVEHRSEINRAILSHFCKAGISEENGIELIKRIVKGQIPNISINY